MVAIRQISLTADVSDAQARIFGHLAKEQNFWNRSTFLKKHQILLRRLKESFSENSVKISDCRAAAGHIATVMVLLDSS